MSLELHDITIRLGRQTLLDGLSATVQPGQVLTVMGPSGSGKSTLLAYIGGALAPVFAVNGRVVLDGQEIQDRPMAARRVGILFQDDLLFPHMTVLENLLFAVPAGASRSERTRRAEAALDEAGLSGYGARWPKTLSGGQRARVSVLRALLAQPKALLLDEPFSKLDAALRKRFREFVFEHVEHQKIPTLLVSHDPTDRPPGGPQIELAEPAGPDASGGPAGSDANGGPGEPGGSHA